jgi:hypothetical protein
VNRVKSLSSAASPQVARIGTRNNDFGISEFLLTAGPNQPYRDSVPPPYEGRFAIVTDVRRDAVDADALLTNGAEADGEVVWS